jgi:putrescine:ornithine antiporter
MRFEPSQRSQHLRVGHFLAGQSRGPLHHRRAARAIMGCLAALTIFTAPLAILTAPLAHAVADTLDKVKQSGKLVLGYRTDAGPFSFRDASNNPTGYSVALCQKVADQVKADLGLSNLAIDWVEVTAADQIQAVKDGKIDLLCSVAVESITRRRDVDFSIPIYAGGIGALMRTDASLGLKDVLLGQQSTGPLWRGNPVQILENKVFAVMAKSPTETWLSGRIDYFKVTSKVMPVDDYDAGVSSVLNRNADVFFAERPILLDAVRRNQSGSALVVLERRFTYEPLGLVLARDNDNFRLAVDTALSHVYGDDAFKALYAQWFGDYTEETATFFKLNTLRD